MERIGKKLGLKDKDLILDDSQIKNYRHPSERPLLFLAALFIAGTVAAAIFFEKYDILTVITSLWFGMFCAANLALTKYRVTGLEVTERQLPQLFEDLQALRARFKAPKVKLYIIGDPKIDVFTIGFKEPYVMVFTSTLIKELNRNQLNSIMGEQLGHIILGHTRLSILFGGKTESLPSIIKWLGSLRNTIFGWYRRCEYFSADRIALLACRDQQTVIETLILRGIGLPPEVLNFEEMARTAFTIK